MLIELGNSAPINAIDHRPCVTTIYVPEFDDGSEHPDAQYEGGRDEEGRGVGQLVKPGPKLGGYIHTPGAVTSDDFRAHVIEAKSRVKRNIPGELDEWHITNLPDSEILLSVEDAWGQHGYGFPDWVNVIADPLTPDGIAADVQKFLAEFYRASEGAPSDMYEKYWTKAGPPGSWPDIRPDAQAVFTNTGRSQQFPNYLGGQAGTYGAGSVGTAPTTTTYTTGATFTLNQWAGYRLTQISAGGTVLFANILSNTTGGVLTIDRWYNVTTPGGSAATTPSASGTYLIADGGTTSAWFIGLTTTNITPAATDTTMSGEYTTASGGYVRKIAPVALTSGVSPVTFTATPVFTGNGSDTYPSTFYALGGFCSMVVGAAPAMKDETSLNASATVNASGDQVTCTLTWTGS